MTSEERKALNDMRNRLVEEIARIDAMLEVKPRSSPAKKELKPTPVGLLRIRRLFNHRDDTLPHPKELEAYLSLTKRYTKDTFYPTIDLMERFYKLRPRGRPEPDRWSHDSLTLINNWDRKVASAKDFLKDKPTSADKVQDRPKIPEPEHWREWAAGNWPQKGRDYWLSVKWEQLEGPSNVQLEIHRNCR